MSDKEYKSQIIKYVKDILDELHIDIITNIEFNKYDEFIIHTYDVNDYDVFLRYDAQDVLCHDLELLKKDIEKDIKTYNVKTY